MVYGVCPMCGAYGFGGFYITWIFIVMIFSVIFWGIYHLFIKDKKIIKDKKTKSKRKK